MGLSTGTIVSDTPNTALSTIFKTLVGGSGVANWSFVENIPAGTGAGQSGSASYSCDVYKCAGTGDDANDAGVDWYFYITSSDFFTTSIYSMFSMAEYYNDENKTFKGLPLNYAGGTSSDCSINADDYLYYGAYTSGDFKAPLDSHAGRATPVLNQTGFRYWIVLDNDFVLVSFRVGINSFSYYFGLMDSLINAAGLTDEYPLVFASASSTNTNMYTASTFLRYPGIGAQSSYNNVGRVEIIPWQLPGLTHQIADLDLWLGNKIFVSRPLLYHYVSGAKNNIYGCVRGLLKSEIKCIYEPATTASGIGDTVTIDGTTWTIVGTIGYCNLLYEGA